MTIEQLDKINFGRHSFNVEFLPYLNLGFVENAMELKPLRQAAFLANVIHESGGFRYNIIDTKSDFLQSF